MAHPKETKHIDGKLFHLEDSGLTKVEARALKKHLRSTEDKKVRTQKASDGWKVYWSKH